MHAKKFIFVSQKLQKEMMKITLTAQIIDLPTPFLKLTVLLLSKSRLNPCKTAEFGFCLTKLLHTAIFRCGLAPAVQMQTCKIAESETS